MRQENFPRYAGQGGDSVRQNHAGWGRRPNPLNPPRPIAIPLYPLLFSLFAQITFPRYGNVYFTFPIPFQAIPLERWQCLLYFLAMFDSIVHDVCMCVCVYIYIYIYASLCVGDYALCMMDSYGYVSNLLWPCVNTSQLFDHPPQRRSRTLYTRAHVLWRRCAAPWVCNWNLS